MPLPCPLPALKVHAGPRSELAIERTVAPRRPKQVVTALISMREGLNVPVIARIFFVWRNHLDSAVKTALVGAAQTVRSMQSRIEGLACTFKRRQRQAEASSNPSWTRRKPGPSKYAREPSLLP